MERARRERFLSWLFVLVAVASWLPGVSTQALVDPDEGRNASIALEMARGGSPIVPRLNGLPFLDKPFLYFHLQSLSIRALGASELAVRLPSILASALLLALVAGFAYRVWGERVAWISALALATSLLSVAFARIASFDAVLSLATTAAILAFSRALGVGGEDDPARAAVRRERDLVLAWLAMAVGVMVKGPVALLLPLGVAQAFAWLRGNGRGPWSIRGVASFAAPLAVWLLVTESAAPGFLRYALFEESWKRVTTDQFARTGPVWYFVPILLTGAFPWILGAIPGARAAIRRRQPEPWSTRFLAIWLLLPLLLFSFSQSKRPQYVLPLIPAVALLAGRALADERVREAFARRAAVAWLGFGLLLLGIGTWQAPGAELLDHLRPGESIRFSYSLGALCIAAAAAVWALRGRARASIAAAAIPVLALPLLSLSVVAEVSEARSGRRLARSISRLAGEGREIVGIETFVPSLPFYLRDSIRLSSATLQPLTSRSMLHFAHEIASRQPGSWRPAEWWRSTLRHGSDRFVYVVKPNRTAEIEVLERAGLSKIFDGEKFLAYARTASGPRRAGLSVGRGGGDAAGADRARKRHRRAERRHHG